eukprot:CAMPEP_0204212446 /NCGR_PEP_ID=MMETSP0361-20130328/75242_1 /ASSEMBLY_ACC=CAM_ASM_000343 /TAXON_ID=268821 /ORGANISM="Scrippsiella Hangoei, Strain SHTV-5" /LENGTH=36 /DNA_ID= /DNA_START= /DNA_END= /DNA_ORIENTATION=
MSLAILGSVPQWGGPHWGMHSPQKTPQWGSVHPAGG